MPLRSRSATPAAGAEALTTLVTMFLLRGGPRAGQLVDDLPRGYRILGEGTSGPSQLVLGEMVAAVAVWPDEAGTPSPGQAR